MFFTGVRKISDGNTGHNNSLMETRLLGINILFTGEWGGSEKLQCKSALRFLSGSTKQKKRRVILVLKNPADIYIYTCKCLYVFQCVRVSIYAYTLFSSTYLVPGKVVLLRGPGQPYKALIKKKINNKKKKATITLTTNM